MLKRYISEIGGFREPKTQQPSDKNAIPSNTMKIAAPKPVRARPVAFANYSLPKWIQTSPAKSEISEDVSANESQVNNKWQDKSRTLNFEEVPELKF